MTRYNIPTLLAIIALWLTACNKDDPNSLPYDVATVNMFSESYGRTLLGNTDIYISQANNFISPEKYYLVDYGQVLDLGHIEENTSQFTTVTNQAAVLPNEGYLAIERSQLRTFTSGYSAMSHATNYLRIWVKNWIKDPFVPGGYKGAVVLFASFKPQKYDLPDWGSVMGTMSQSTGTNQLQFTLVPKNAEVEMDEADHERFTLDVTQTKSGTVVRVLINPSIQGSVAGKYPLYARVGSTFTKVYFNVI